MTREFYESLRETFRDSRFPIPSLYELSRRVAALSLVNAKDIDCCVNSCMAF
jgi:hypothetical protein